MRRSVASECSRNWWASVLQPSIGAISIWELRSCACHSTALRQGLCAATNKGLTKRRSSPFAGFGACTLGQLSTSAGAVMFRALLPAFGCQRTNENFAALLLVDLLRGFTGSEGLRVAALGLARLGGERARVTDGSFPGRWHRGSGDFCCP